MLGMIFGNGRTFVIMSLGVVALTVIGTQPPAGMEISDELWNKHATPYYLGQVLAPGLMGLLLASLLFADISTTDQYLLTWSTSIVNDCIVPFRNKPFSQKTHINAVRLTIVGLCVLFFIVGLTYSPTLPIWEYLWLCANIIGGTGIAVLFGMYWKRATTAGAYAAILTNLTLPVADLIARNVLRFISPETDYPWTAQTTGLSSYLLGMFLLVVVSLVSREESKYWDLGRTVKDLNRSKD
jgi:SSS family solute:Na+ symporter